MSMLTNFLKLFKKDPVLDKNDTFNITTMLNENWDKIDAGVKELSDNQTAAKILEKLKTVDGVGSGLDADMVRGGYPMQAYKCSDRDLEGVLIKTSLPIAELPLVIDIKGHPYGANNKPIDLTICSYFYNGSFYAPGTYGKASGGSINGLKLMRVDGNLAIWFPKQGYYSGYEVKVTVDLKGFDGINYATEIVASPTQPPFADLVYEPVIHRTMFGRNVSGVGVAPGAWSATGSGYVDYPAWFRVTDSMVKASDQVTVAFAPEYLRLATEAGAEVTKSDNGSFLLLAKKPPIANVYFDYSVVGW